MRSYGKLQVPGNGQSKVPMRPQGLKETNENWQVRQNNQSDRYARHPIFSKRLNFFSISHFYTDKSIFSARLYIGDNINLHSRDCNIHNPILIMTLNRVIDRQVRFTRPMGFGFRSRKIRSFSWLILSHAHHSNNTNCFWIDHEDSHEYEYSATNNNAFVLYHTAIAPIKIETVR